MFRAKPLLSYIFLIIHFERSLTRCLRLSKSSEELKGTRALLLIYMTSIVCKISELDSTCLPLTRNFDCPFTGYWALAAPSEICLSNCETCLLVLPDGASYLPDGTICLPDGL